MSIKHNTLQNNQRSEEVSQKEYNPSNDKKSGPVFQANQNRANSKARKQSWSKHTEVKSHQRQEINKSQQRNNTPMSKNSTKRMVCQQDKKTVQNDKALSKRKMQQAESQQNASLQQKRKQKLLHSDTNPSKIKISGRPNKQLALANHNQKLSKQSVGCELEHKSQSLLHQEKIITEIATEIQLNLQSKVTAQPKEGSKGSHSFHEIKESVSEVEASPTHKQQSAGHNKHNHVPVGKGIPQYKNHSLVSPSLVLQDKIIKQASLKKNDKGNQQINSDKKLQSISDQPKIPQANIDHRLKMEGNTINLKLQEFETKPNPNHAVQANNQLKTLRQTIQDLRLEKVKAIAEGYDKLQSQQTLKPEQQGRNKQNTVNTLVNELESEADRASIKAQIYLGRIVRNKFKSQSKQQNTTQNQLTKAAVSVDKHYSDLAQKVKTIELYEQKPSHSQLNTLNIPNTKEYEFDRDAINDMIGHDSRKPSKMFFTKTRNSDRIIDKFMTTQSKFRHFVSRERTKSANKFSITLLKNDLKDASKLISIDNSFEGTIIKNIVRPSVENEQIIFSNTIEAKFIDYRIIAAIKAAEFKNIEKKTANFTKREVPQIPNPPQYNSSLQEIMESILQVLPLAKVEITKKQLSGCSLKKYKNCIMLGLPQDNRFKLVWHFTGKLFMGGWNNQTNEKAGQGLEIISKIQFYQGQFSSGKKYGKGIHIQAYSSIYEGEFINGEKHGKGKYLNKADNSFYEGEWNSGKMEGFGYLDSDGNVYQGQFKANFKQGFGVQQFQNGDRYIGEHRADKFQGQGKYSWANGSSYLGHFKGSNRDGFGKWVSQEEFSQVYMGFYLHDKKHGSGTYRWKNGCIYEGNFDSDKKHGMGSLQYPDGRVVEGIWKQGVLTKVISKIRDAHSEQPLQGKKKRASSNARRNEKKKS